MRKSHRESLPYTWSRFIANAIWLTVFITLFVKVAEALSR